MINLSSSDQRGGNCHHQNHYQMYIQLGAHNDLILFCILRVSRFPI
jgi:hypothetical protein